MFFDQQIGSIWRNEYRYLYKKNINTTWTPILEITRKFNISRKSDVQIMRSQFPLRPASAKTIHRSQGDTIEQLVVEYNTREHMHYVALSRVTNLKSLQICNLNEKKISASEKVPFEMTRLREEAIIDLSSIYHIKQEDVIKVLFPNVRSLHLHIDDVKVDFNIQACDIVNFAETALASYHPSDLYKFSSFNLHRNDHNSINNQRSP